MLNKVILKKASIDIQYFQLFSKNYRKMLNKVVKVLEMSVKRHKYINNCKKQTSVTPKQLKQVIVKNQSNISPWL